MSAEAPLAGEARRLAVAAALTRAVRALVGTVTPASAPAELEGLARRLTEAPAAAPAASRARFAPPYPGRTAGAEPTPGGARIVLACSVVDDAGTPVGVAFTSLIAGRPPQVSVAPPGAHVPDGWRLLSLDAR